MGFLDNRNHPEGTGVLEELKDYGAYQEGCIFIEAMDLSAEDRAELVESPEFLALEAKGLIGRKTIVKLKLSDDLERRVTMAAFQLAKEDNYHGWNKLAANRVKERDLIEDILTKYRTKAIRVARAGQKDYVKTIRSGGTVKKAEIAQRANA